MIKKGDSMNKINGLTRLLFAGLIVLFNATNSMYQEGILQPTSYQQGQAWTQQEYQPAQQPIFHFPEQRASAPLETIRKTTVTRTMRQQPSLESTEEYIAPEEQTSEYTGEPVSPVRLSGIALNAIELWNIYDKARRTSNGQFTPTDWEKINEKTNNIANEVQESNNDLLTEVFKQFEPILDSPTLFDKSIFGQALNNIIETVNMIAKRDPNKRYSREYALNDVPYLLYVSEPIGGLFTAQKAVTGTLYEYTKPVASAIGGAISTGYDWTRWAASGIGSGLSSARKWALPTEEEVEIAKQKLQKVQAEIRRLRSKPSLSQDDKLLLEKYKQNEYEYRSIIRGWGPTLGGAALIGGYLGYKYLTGGSGTPAAQ